MIAMLWVSNASVPGTMMGTLSGDDESFHMRPRSRRKARKSFSVWSLGVIPDLDERDCGGMPRVCREPLLLVSCMLAQVFQRTVALEQIRALPSPAAGNANDVHLSQRIDKAWVVDAMLSNTNYSSCAFRDVSLPAATLYTGVHDVLRRVRASSRARYIQPAILRPLLNS